MKEKKYFCLTKIARWILFLLGSVIFLLGIASFCLYYIKNNYIYNYYNTTDASLLLPDIFTGLEILIGLYIISLLILGFGKRRLLFISIITFLLAIYFLVVFFIFLFQNIFDTYTVQTYIYPLYSIIFLFISWSFFLNYKNIEVKLINHNKINHDQIEDSCNLNDINEENQDINLLNEQNENVEDKAIESEINEENQDTDLLNEKIENIEDEAIESEINEEQPKHEEIKEITFDFVEPTLEDKTEEEIIEIQKNWEETAQKLNVLKFSELKAISWQKNIKLPKSVKKVQIVNLLKKIVKIYTQVTEDLTDKQEIQKNSEKLEMLTLVELKNIVKKEEFKIFPKAIKKDYVQLLKDKIIVRIEFII